MSEGADVTAKGAGRALLSADDVFGIASLELRARTVAEGVLVGSHRSRRFGSSTEFAEHKVYAPGDELKHLDWKAYARMDRYFVRRYEEEANLDVSIVVDASGSMGYAGGARGAYHHSKLDYACTLAAALAFLASRRSDGVGLSLFAGGERGVLPPRARKDRTVELFRMLEQVTAEGTTDVVSALESVARRLTRNALVVLVTDLLDVGEDALAPLAILRRRGADVLVLHVLDPDELHFPFDGVVRFVDMEGDREVQVDAPGVRDAYLEELSAFLGRVKRGAADLDLRYLLAASDEPPARVLREALLGSALLRGGAS